VGGTACPVQVDVADPDQVERAATQIETVLGPIDIWINNAMATVFSPIKEMTPDDLIAAVDDGVLIDGRGSYSIDQQRYNFQFGGDAFWEIKGGKRGKMISRVAYQSRTPDFWANLAGVADKRFWVNHGLTSDGKGQPGQINAMSHGCSPCLFRQVNVLLTD